MNLSYREALREKLEDLKRNLKGRDSKRFYHLRSVENFIYHIDKIHSQSEREKMYDLLMTYFEASNQYSHYITIEDSLVLFNKYLKPIGKYYSDNHGFWIFVKPWIIIVWIMIFFISMILFNVDRIVYVFFVLILSIYLCYIAKKFIQKKVYSFLW